MHTIIVISQEKVADEKLTRKLRHLFPECRIRVVQRPDPPNALTPENHPASSSCPAEDN